mmetsp:Transcript_30107/g.70319  ORF Transcript_30107/g.70319 Transcript_30107/m.70319 type:complete len:733 (+) Transcript_30107:62-2260(+)
MRDPTLSSLLLGFVLASATAASASGVVPDPPAPPPEPIAAPDASLQLVSLTLVVRHGDRSPLTPTLSREYWWRKLPPRVELYRVATGTRTRRTDRGIKEKPHSATGDGTFGTLTQMGVSQMEALGAQLREELVSAEGVRPEAADAKLLTAQFAPPQLKLHSTDFPRTIQSMQALLAGLYLPEERPASREGFVHIDVSDGARMLPDPEPESPGASLLRQRELESAVRQSEAFRLKEQAMAPLAKKLVEALVLSGAVGSKSSLFAPDHASAPAVASPVPESLLDSHGGHEAGEWVPKGQRVHWGRLIEVLGCIRAHGLLPLLSDAAETQQKQLALAQKAGLEKAAKVQIGWELRGSVGQGAEADTGAADTETVDSGAADSGSVRVTEADVEAAITHGAWRWFRVLREPEIAMLAMGPLAKEMVLALYRQRAEAIRAARRARIAGELLGAVGERAERAAEAEGCLRRTIRTGLFPCQPKLTIYSAHDSTLVGLLSVFCLGAPDHWPTYGTALRLELVRNITNSSISSTAASSTAAHSAGKEGASDALSGALAGALSGSAEEAQSYGVRFVLGGQVLAVLPDSVRQNPYAEVEHDQAHPGMTVDKVHGEGASAVVSLDALLDRFQMRAEAEGEAAYDLQQEAKARAGLQDIYADEEEEKKKQKAIWEAEEASKAEEGRAEMLSEFGREVAGADAAGKLQQQAMLQQALQDDEDEKVEMERHSIHPTDSGGLSKDEL